MVSRHQQFRPPAAPRLPYNSDEMRLTALRVVHLPIAIKNPRMASSCRTDCQVLQVKNRVGHAQMRGKKEKHGKLIAGERSISQRYAGATDSSTAAVRFDRERVLSRLDELSRVAQEKGQLSAAVRAEELIGRARGLF